MEPTHGAGDERPVEHVPITVYWQRRAVVGLLVVALVAALAFAVTSWRQRAAAAGAGEHRVVEHHQHRLEHRRVGDDLHADG